MSIRGCADAAGVIGLLWANFDANSASDADLFYLAGASEEASNMAHSLSATASGIACLIAEDRDRQGVKHGALQGDDLPTLLWGIAGTARAIEKLAFVGGEAGFLLQERYRDRPERERGRRTNHITSSDRD
ncbi:hypothetical protein [Caballeronia sp. S22]|uniref:hypothetical protein n=1 Tax=Caballeronia sp. S22 TaxID=3137182 RepID=UPI00353120E4